MPDIRCAHCSVVFNSNDRFAYIDFDIDNHWFIKHAKCRSCSHLNLQLIRAKNMREEDAPFGGWQKVKLPENEQEQWMVRPFGRSYMQLPDDVPDNIAMDYKSSCETIGVSPKASAALSRRCLQTLLRHFGFERKTLDKEIDAILDANQLPSYIAKDLDAVRMIGNFAAHPIKCESTGEIVDVELGEAEWNIQVLEALLDFYFIQPVLREQRKQELNAKLRAAGSPELP